MEPPAQQKKTLGKRKDVPCDREDCMEQIVRGIKGYVAQEVDLTDPVTKAALVKEYLLGLLEEAATLEIGERIEAMKNLQEEMNRLAQAQMIDEDFQADMRFKIEAAIKIAELLRTQNLTRENVAELMRNIQETAQQNDWQDLIYWARERESTAGEQLQDFLTRKLEELFQKAQETATAANEMVNTVAKPSFYFLMTIICSMPESCQEFLRDALETAGLGWLYTLAISYCAFWQTQTGLVLYRKVTGMTPDEKNALFTKLKNLTSEGCIKFSVLLNTLVAAAGRGVASAATKALVLGTTSIDTASDIAVRGLRSAADMHTHVKDAVLGLGLDLFMTAFNKEENIQEINPVEVVLRFQAPFPADSQDSTGSNISVVSVEPLQEGQPLTSEQVVVPAFVRGEVTQEAMAAIEERAQKFFDDKYKSPASSPQSSFDSQDFIDTSSMDHGGRRRKSRRHKKRKSTLKRRRLKRRRTRKGKKRRHTRKR